MFYKMITIINEQYNTEEHRVKFYYTINDEQKIQMDISLKHLFVYRDISRFLMLKTLKTHKHKVIMYKIHCTVLLNKLDV